MYRLVIDVSTLHFVCFFKFLYVHNLSVMSALFCFGGNTVRPFLIVCENRERLNVSALLAYLE